jgi:hypothetical protein
LVLWTQANRPGPLEIQNLPCRIRQFSAERLVAEDLSNLSKQPYPLSQLYWSINRSILRSIGRGRARSRRLAGFEYWQLFWICTRGRQQMLCPVNISTDRHEARLRAIRVGGLAIPRRLCVAIYIANGLADIVNSNISRELATVPVAADPLHRPGCCNRTTDPFRGPIW